MRTSTVMVCLVLATSGVAHGEGTPTVAKPSPRPSANASLRRMGPLTTDLMPMVSPQANRALTAAKRTLVAAQAHVVKEVASAQKRNAGFLSTRYELGKPSFGNENALYAKTGTGARYHIGYAMEMHVDPRSTEQASDGSPLAPGVPVIVSLRGKILMPLFRGEKAVFVMGHKGLPVAAINRVGDRDLKAKHPLDYQARVLQRIQARMGR